MSDQFEARSPYRCAVRDDFIGGGVSITFAIIYKWDAPMRIMHFNEEGIQSFTDHEAMAVIDKPSMRIQEEFARALYEELGRYFQGQPDQTASRADYLAERKAHEIAEERYHQLAMRAVEVMGELA